MKVPVAIPVYQPTVHFLKLIKTLTETHTDRIIVVNDGSGADYEEVFQAAAALPRVHVLRHAFNLGKGAALKTAFNFALAEAPELLGVVTADGDGQHGVDDIVAVADALARRPQALILGVRQFDRTVPLRNRVGNALTRQLLRVLTGQTLADTQTGLRGIPGHLVPDILRLPTNGYEFELDMLLLCKHRSCPVVQQPIRTIYVDDNRSSHFDPILDSMRIYFVLFRFALNSVATAVIDNLAFGAAYSLGGSILSAQVAGRLLAIIFNYTAARRMVFLSQERHCVVFPKYLLVVLTSGMLSYGLIRLFLLMFPFPVLAAKILSETLLFGVNFAIQRDLVFTSRHGNESRSTNWDRYYQRVFPTARLTRRHTISVLLRAIRRFALSGGGRCDTIVELGGGNSCFFEAVRREVGPREYHVIDNNQYSLAMLRQRTHGDEALRIHCGDVLDLRMTASVDLVFSVGLIEHFGQRDLPTVVGLHFDLLKVGGLAIMSFPTPTWMYRAARFCCERLGLWAFPDERALRPEEVCSAIGERGEVLYERVLWPLVFTQRFVVMRKRPPQDICARVGGPPGEATYGT